jgi:two-component system chemotaxis response regulator CheB
VIEAVVIGVSAGGLKALSEIIPSLPRDFDIAVIVVQHVREGSDDFLARNLDSNSAVRVKEADEKESIMPGTVYIAPAGYHLLVEEDRTFGLSIEGHVNFARPSIDVLFESAAEVYGERLAGVILTGANSDGARGLAAVKQFGGLTLVQNPETAEVSVMPAAAINATQVDHILELSDFASFIAGINAKTHA